MSHSLFHRFTHSQQSLSRWFDRLLPVDYQVDGNHDFAHNWIAPYLKPGAVVYDIGGGKNPLIGGEEKRRLGLTNAGLDIDARELAASPSGDYGQKICDEITQVPGGGDADLGILQGAVPHVKGSRGRLV